MGRWRGGEASGIGGEGGGTWRGVEAPGIDGAGCCSRDPAVAVELVEISLMLLLTEHFFIAVLFLGKCCWFRLFHKSENFPQDLKTKHSLWISYVVLNYRSKSTKNNKHQPPSFRAN
jgi:hypothetical protein